MRSATLMGFGAVAMLAGTTWAGRPQTPPALGQPRWLSDFPAAQAEARRNARPILAVLH